MAAITQAVVLAAGKGERLYPLNTLRPKVMLRLANKPILQYVVEALARCGVREVVLVVGYRREQVQDHFGGGEEFGVEVRYVHQEQQLGTAHALACARGLVEGRFLVLPGDNIVAPETVAPLLECTEDTVLVKEGVQRRRYGVVLLEGDRVVDLVEKPQEPISPWLNTGIYCLDDAVFEVLGGELDLPVALLRWLRQGHPLRAVRTEVTWLDAMHPWDLLHLNALALAGTAPRIEGTVEEGATVRGPVSIGRGTVVRAGSYIVGPAAIGEGCEVGPGVCVFPHSSVGHQAVLGPWTVVRNSIIESSVEVGPHSLVHDSVLAQGCTAAGGLAARCGTFSATVDGETLRVRAGAIVAEYVELGYGVTLGPGVLVGKGTRVRDGKVVTEGLPEDALVL